MSNQSKVLQVKCVLLAAAQFLFEKINTKLLIELEERDFHKILTDYPVEKLYFEKLYDDKRNKPNMFRYAVLGDHYGFEQFLP